MMVSWDSIGPVFRPDRAVDKLVVDAPTTMDYSRELAKQVASTFDGPNIREYSHNISNSIVSYCE